MAQRMLASAGCSAANRDRTSQGIVAPCATDPGRQPAASNAPLCCKLLHFRGGFNLLPPCPPIQIWEEMNLAYSSHEIIADFTTAAFLWLESG